MSEEHGYRAGETTAIPDPFRLETETLPDEEVKILSVSEKSFVYKAGARSEERSLISGWLRLQVDEEEEYQKMVQGLKEGGA